MLHRLKDHAAEAGWMLWASFIGPPHKRLMLLASCRSTHQVLVIIVPWFVVFTWGCLWVTDKIIGLRVSGR
jgi:hypothetical protein